MGHGNECEGLGSGDDGNNDVYILMRRPREW